MPKYTIFNIILIGLLALNLLTIKSTVLGVIALTLFVIFSSFTISRWLQGSLIFGFLAFIFSTTILTSIFYFTYKLNELSLILILLILFFLQFLPRLIPRLKPALHSNTPVYQSENRNKISASFFMTLIVYALFGLGIFILFRSQTVESIVSPWAVMPRQFLVILFLMAFALIYFKKITTLSILPLFILSSSVALIVYKIGYGFDGFVHEAALRYIDEFGVITPKTPYYIGLYGLEVFLSKFSSLDISTINRILLPLIFAFLLPLLFVQSSAFVQNRTLNKKTVLLLLLLPITSFIATTPQGLANLFLLIIILTPYILGNGRYPVTHNHRYTCFLVLAALATMSIHIVAGLPAILFLLLCFFGKKLTKKTLVALIMILTLIVPVSFWILAKLYPDFIKFGFTASSWQSLSFLLPDFKTHYNFWLDLIYFAEWLGKALFAVLVILGLIKIWQNIKLRLILPYIGMFIILLINFAALHTFFSFPSLIFYEQTDFAKRFYWLSFYFLIPLALAGGTVFFERLNNQSRLIRITSSALLAFIITSSIYISYPRKDAYEVSHGFSTSIHDLETVRAIDEDAVEDKYIVLANQAVSAAALHEFGFFKPFIKTAKDEVYFYSIPTGGQLYKYYFKMVYEKPRAEIAQEAAKFAGVETVYFVINDYWWNAKKLIEEAKLEASNWQEINDGRLVIFKYKIKQE